MQSQYIKDLSPHSFSRLNTIQSHLAQMALNIAVVINKLSSKK